ncbi:MAG: rRNA methyltransferase, partial [Bacteroidia bacterium]
MNLLIDYLSKLITEERRQVLEKVLDQRTRYITVVLEDIFQPQNASAVLRTCDCFGVQNVHIIENENEYRINPDVVKGASKWLTIS